MNKTANGIAAASRKIMTLQLTVSGIVALGFLIGKTDWAAASAAYGGLISVVLAFLLGRGVARATDAAAESRTKSMLILYLGAALRFVLVLALFAAGLGLLKLDPLPVVAGFLGAQLVYIFGARALDNKFRNL